MGLGQRSRSSTRGKYADLPISSSSFEMATDVKGLCYVRKADPIENANKFIEG